MRIPKLGLAVAAIAAIALAMPATAIAAPHGKVLVPLVSNTAERIQRPTSGTQCKGEKTPGEVFCTKVTSHRPTSAHCQPGKVPGETLCTEVTWPTWKDLPASQQAARQRTVAARTRPASVPTGPSQCEFDTAEDVPPVSIFPDRLTACSDSLVETTVQSCVNGVCTVTGTFTTEDQQWVLFSKSSGQWTHGLIVIGLGGTGDLAAGLEGTVGSNCTTPIGHPGPCDAVGIDGTSNPDTLTINPGSYLGPFTWSEADTGPATTETGQIDTFDSILGVDWTFESPSGTSVADDVGSLAGRCDSVYTSTTGCVDEQFFPALVLSLAKDGASAAMIQWAQQNTSASWGNVNGGVPLQRLANSAQAAANRDVICDSTFKKFGSYFGGDFGDTDSCDEYPFAATYQSGANAVTSGSQCAQVSAVESGPTNGTEAAAWNSVKADGTFSLDVPCVRGHIPNLLNGLVGGDYGVFIGQERLLDADYFYVMVVSS